jgi:hypothetical protein
MFFTLIPNTEFEGHIDLHLFGGPRVLVNARNARFGPYKISLACKVTGLEHSYQTPYFFCQFGSKKPTFAQIVKALLHQTPYFNFTILFFNISLLFFFFSQLPKYYTTKKHYYTKKISFLFPQLMNSGSGSHCSSIAHFQWYREADVSHFCCLFLIFCVFRPIVNSNKNVLRALTLASLKFLPIRF